MERSPALSILLALTSLAVTATGVDVVRSRPPEPAAWRPASVPSLAALPSFDIRMPKSSPYLRAADGRYHFVFKTNLPEGTLVAIETRTPDRAIHRCCRPVHDGHLELSVIHNPCIVHRHPHDTFYGGVSYGVDLWIEAAVRQSEAVLAILGRHFERLAQAGPDHSGRHAFLVASRDYTLGVDCSWGPQWGPDPETRVTLNPDHGPVGTRVLISGVGFTAPWFQNHEGTFFPEFLGEIGPCEILAGDDSDYEVNRRGELTGWLIVPSHGGCFQGRPDELEHRIVPGRYVVMGDCHACSVGEFFVTPS